MAPVLVDIRTPAARSEPAGLIQGYADLVIEVSDIERAKRFYCEVLGFESNGQTPDGPRLKISAQQGLVLAQRPTPRTLPGSGTHQAYCFPRPQLEAVLARLYAAGVELFGYREDRPAERFENRYAFDPDGNRVQLVVGETAGIDHAAVETHDLEWAEVFYTHVLGGVVETRVGWRMDDYVGALAWGDGQDQCAPGTRRWDKRYTTVEGKAEVPRPNAHIFVSFAPGVSLGIYLATEHRQEPPPDQFLGTPRFVFQLVAGGVGELERRLKEIRLRCMRASEQFGGPFEWMAASIFIRDPAGNFLEVRE